MKRKTKKNPPRTEHLPPTWEGVFRIYVEAYRNTGDPKHLVELERMSRLADKWVNHVNARTKHPVQVEEQPLIDHALTLLDDRSTDDYTRLLALVFWDLRVNGLSEHPYNLKQLRDFDND